MARKIITKGTKMRRGCVELEQSLCNDVIVSRCRKFKLSIHLHDIFTNEYIKFQNHWVIRTVEEARNAPKKRYWANLKQIYVQTSLRLGLRRTFNSISLKFDWMGKTMRNWSCTVFGPNRSPSHIRFLNMLYHPTAKNLFRESKARADFVYSNKHKDSSDSRS